MGMGYPGASITNPGDGTYTFSCYESSEKIAGVIAWYYEREGLRPMMRRPQPGRHAGGEGPVEAGRPLGQAAACLESADLEEGGALRYSRSR